MAKKNGYTAKQFIGAIPGTGGVITAIAERVGCSWNTAKKYIEEYATVREAYDQECNRITDTARNNIIQAIERKHAPDLSLSKWWLQVKDSTFRETTNVNVSGEQVVRIVWPEQEVDD